MMNVLARGIDAVKLVGPCKARVGSRGTRAFVRETLHKKTKTTLRSGAESNDERGFSVPLNSRRLLVFRTRAPSVCASASSDEGSVGPTVSLQAPRDGGNGGPPEDPEGASLETFVESALFNSRFLSMFGVVGSMVGSLTMFLKGAIVMIAVFIGTFSTVTNSGVDELDINPGIVAAIDDYLLATVLLVFGLGLYELFISEIDDEAIESTSGMFGLSSRPAWLATKSLDDLKKKLAKVIIMSLLVKSLEFFEEVHVENSHDMLEVAGAVTLCSFAMYLAGLGKQDGIKL